MEKPKSSDIMEHDSYHYSPLPEDSFEGLPTRSRQRPLKGFAVIVTSVVLLMSLVGLILNNKGLQPSVETDSNGDNSVSPETMPELQKAVPRGVAEGVSAKSDPAFSDEASSYNWTSDQFAWQRTAYHFQPQKNWMNDPDGPLFHMGWYHLFYQYNPDSAVWGNITWGHAVSRDLIHWLYLPIALRPDQWYDINGVWTGSATLLPDGQIVMLYTGDTNASIQVQCLAHPANLSDPLLLDWVKYDANPVMVPPSGIATDEFRDPTTGWLAPDGTWRIIIGSTVNGTGIALNYKTTNFTYFELLDNILHAVQGTGEWECVDFYPVNINGSNGPDTSAYGPGTKHVLKASLDNTKRDVYALGTYYPENNTWTPDDPKQDVGIGLEVDYGRYYASKTFYDQNKQRRILWGWTNETDTEGDDLQKGWASVQTIPRVVTFDNKTGTNILEWPVEEIESLRLNSTEFTEVEVAPGSVVALDIGSASQLDIIAEFEYEVLESNDTEVVSSGCGSGAIDRSTYGPFGLLVIADESLSELTPIYFNIANSTDEDSDGIEPYFCADESRSSLAPGVQRFVYGSSIPVLDDEKLSMRVLVDHSMIESFGQGGRRVITSRVYPTEAIYGAAKLFLFNNATGVTVKASLKIWELDSAFIQDFPFDQI